MSVRKIKKKQKQKPFLVEDQCLGDDELAEDISNKVHLRQNILNELNLIKDKVNQVLENYEESGHTSAYTNEEMAHVKSLIAKFEENQKQKKAALTTVKNLCRAQIENFEEFDFEYSMDKIPLELLKDIQHHEFQNAYDAAVKSLNELKSIMSFASHLSKESEDLLKESSDKVEDTKESDKSEQERRVTLSLKSDYTNIFLKQKELIKLNSRQQEELESISKELQSEKEKSINAIGEVSRLKKELTQKHKEVEFLQRNSKMQDVTKNNSTRYYNNSNDKMIPTVRPQTVKQQERILKCKDKSSTVLMEKDMPIKTESITKSCNEEGLITKPKGFSITNSYKKEALVTKPKSFSNLSKCPSPVSIKNLHSFRRSHDHEAKFDTHMHGSQTTEFKDNSNHEVIMLNIPLSNGCTNVDNKGNDKTVASNQQKKEHRSLDIHSSKMKVETDINSSQAKQGDLDPVKLPEVNYRPGNKQSEQKPSSEAIESSIIDLHDKEQLMANKIKEDQKDALIKEPVHGISEEKKLAKATNVMMEYVNMSQLMNKILKEHCEQDNETYQLGVLTEKESRNTIIKHYSEFVESMISTVDSVDKEMQRDGIFGGECFIQDLKRQWLDPQFVTMQKEQSKDFITMITNALEMINYNCHLYLQNKKQSIIDQEKRLASLQKVNPQVYQKCIKQLQKIAQLPDFIDKFMQKGSQQIRYMLEDYIVNVQSAIQTVNHKRELLTMETKSKIQNCIPEINKTINKISSICAGDDSNSTVDELHSSVRQLNKLSSNIQIIRQFSTRGDDATEKAPLSFMEKLNSAITELQGQVKNFISSKLGIQVPNQFDLEVTSKSVHNTAKHSTPVLPLLSSRYIQDLKGQGCNELVHCRQPSFSSDNQRFKESRARRNSILDPLMHHSPLETIVQSSNLANGIQGVTICKQKSYDCSAVTSKCNGQNINNNQLPPLPRLHNDHRRRKSQPDSITLKIKMNKRSVEKHDNSRRGDPLNCLKITSLGYKSSK